MSTTTALLPVHKTKRMIEIERVYGNDTRGHDIREIILYLLETEPRDRDAAGQIRIYPDLLSHWIKRLGIDDAAKAARESRTS